MSQLYYTTCNPITIGCQLFQDSGTTTSVSAGFYSNGNDCFSVDVSGYVTGTTVCICSECDPLYTWSAYSETCCYRVDVTGATAPTSTINLASHTVNVYSSFGSQFMATGFNLNGTGTVEAQLTTPVAGGGYTGTLWGNPSSNTTDGPLNRTALWTSPYGSDPTDTWLGFSACLSGITTEKTYYVGIGADNEFRLVLDGTEIVNTYGNVWTDQQFKWWHVYPVLIGAGNHTIELYGLNNESDAGFGCEIYDNTLQQLTGFTSYTQLNVIFTSSGQTQATILQDLSGNYSSSGFTCPSGFTYTECDGNCYKYTYCCSTGATPTPTATATLTPTPTATLGDSLYVYAKYIDAEAQLQYNVNLGSDVLIGNIDSLSCTYFYTITGLTNGDQVNFSCTLSEVIAGSPTDCPLSAGSCTYTYNFPGTGYAYITVDGNSNC